MVSNLLQANRFYIKLFIGSISVLISTFLFGAEIILVKQWHLSPKVDTRNINQSKSLPQYTNQSDIYQYAKKMIEKGQLDVVISEGCEGTIDAAFVFEHNGWNYERLKKQLGKNTYKDVLALIPLKLAVEFGKNLKVLCGDSLDLIKKHQLAFSETRGFISYMQRLVENRSKNPKKYQAYLKGMLGKKVVADPVNYARAKALEHLADVEKYIDLRNRVFVSTILKHRNDNLMLIVGGIHVKGIKAILDAKGIKSKVVTPKGYDDADEKLLHGLKDILSKKIGKLSLEFFQVPTHFDLKKFPIKNLLPLKKLVSLEEEKELRKKSQENDFNFDLLRSDFDNDGIRDFTLSTMGERTILSAEDNDWDNDGINNLVDFTVGKMTIAKEEHSRLAVTNIYDLSTVDIEKIQESFKKEKINLITRLGSTVDLLVLNLFLKIWEKVPEVDVKNLVATKPVVSYGKNSFFAYIAQSKTIEIYSDGLNQYILNLLESKYKGVPMRQFVNQIVIPIIIHSLGHELGHALKMSNSQREKICKEQGWSWNSQKTKSKYLQNFRDSSKQIKDISSNYKFNGMGKEDFFKEKKNYEKIVNQLLAQQISATEFAKKTKKMRWSTGTKSTEKAYQLSLLNKMKLPTYYSITKPSEWLAEVFSACLFRLFIPISSTLDEASKYEILIGLRPDVVENRLCQQLGVQ